MGSRRLGGFVLCDHAVTLSNGRINELPQKSDLLTARLQFNLVVHQAGGPIRLARREVQCVKPPALLLAPRTEEHVWMEVTLGIKAETHARERLRPGDAPQDRRTVVV